MPEGDTVRRTAQRLNQALAGAPLSRLELRWGELGGRDLLPATTIRVASRGKHLLHDLDTGVTIHTHLKMEGSWRIEATARTTPRLLSHPQLRVLAQTEAWTTLGLRLGLVEVWPTTETPHRLGHLGPDLLGEDWDSVLATTKIRAPGQGDPAIGAALLDQRNLAGIGTFWAAEGLFLERLNPWQPATTLDPDLVERLLRRLRTLMIRSANTGIQTASGSTGWGQLGHVHARSGLPCHVCGGPIRVAPIGSGTRARVLFYCPRCQGGLAPTDDGQAQRPLGSGVRSRRESRYRGRP